MKTNFIKKLSLFLTSGVMALGVGVGVASSKGIGEVGATSYSITLNATNFGVTGTSYSTYTYTANNITFKAENCNLNNSCTNMKASTGAIYNSTAFSGCRIVSLELSKIGFSSTSSAGFYVYGGNTLKATTKELLNNSGSTSNTTVSFDGYDYTYFYIKNKGTRTARMDVVVNYETMGPTVSEITLSPDGETSLYVNGVGGPESQEFRVGITGTNLTGFETVSIEGLEDLDGYASITTSAAGGTSALRNGDKFTITATAGEGLAEIYAKYSDSIISKSAEIYTYEQSVVKPLIDNPEFGDYSTSMYKGKTQELSFSLNPVDTDEAITVTSSDDSVISLSKINDTKYTLNALKVGQATITVAGSEGVYSSTTEEISVIADTIKSVTVSGSMTKKQYNLNDSWDPTGITVSAYYESAPTTPVPVTSGITWSHNPNKANSITITSVETKATVNGVESSNSVITTGINVTEKSYLGGLTDEARYFLIVGGHVLKASTFAQKGADSHTTNNSDTSNLLESDAWYFKSTGVDNQWYIRTSNDEDASYLYAISNNNGLVSGDTKDSWTVSKGTDSYSGKLLLKDTTNSRYISYTSSANSYIRTYTNTQNGDCAVSFVKYEAPVTYDSLKVTATNINGWTVGQTPTLTTLGATVKAVYSNGDETDVTSSATITAGLPLVKGDAGVNVLTVSYTDSKLSTTHTANITLGAVVQKVTGLTMSTYAPTLDFEDTMTLSVTVNPSDANNKEINWTSSDSSIASVSKDLVDSTKATVTAGTTEGEVTITATAADGSGKTATATFTVVDPSVHVTGIVISGSAKSQYYSGQTFNPSGLTVTTTVTSGSGVDVTNNVVWTPNPLTSNASAVTATYTCDDGTFTDDYSVTVVDQAVQSITVTPPSKLTYRQGDTSLDLSDMVVTAHYQFSDETITSGYTVGGYDLSSRGNQTVTVTFEGKSDQFGIYVTIPELSVSYTTFGDPAYYLINDVSQLNDGDKVMFVGTNVSSGTTSYYAIKPFESGNNFKAVDVTNDLVDDHFDALPAGALEITIGVTGNKYSFGYEENENFLYLHDAGSKKSGSGYNNYMTTSETEEFYSVSISSETSEATVTSLENNATPNMRFNYNNGTPLFSCYNSQQTLFKIYKYMSKSTEDSYIVSEKLFDAVDNAGKLFTCNGDIGSITFAVNPITSKPYSWSDVANMFASVDEAELEKVKTSISDENGNVIEQFLARYDYIVGKYGKSTYSDFLERNPESPSGVINPLITINNIQDTTWIIVIVGLVSLTAVGGYLFIRKRKED